MNLIEKFKKIYDENIKYIYGFIKENNNIIFLIQDFNSNFFWINFNLIESYLIQNNLIEKYEKEKILLDNENFNKFIFFQEILVIDKDKYLIKWINYKLHQLSWEKIPLNLNIDLTKYFIKLKYFNINNINNWKSFIFHYLNEYTYQNKILDDFSLNFVNSTIYNFSQKIKFSIFNNFYQNYSIIFSCFFRYLIENNLINNPILILTQSNLIHKWKIIDNNKENFSLFILNGNQEERQIIFNNFFIYNNKYLFHILVLTSDIFSLDFKII